MQDNWFLETGACLLVALAFASTSMSPLLVSDLGFPPLSPQLHLLGSYCTAQLCCESQSHDSNSNLIGSLYFQAPSLLLWPNSLSLSPLAASLRTRGNYFPLHKFKSSLSSRGRNEKCVCYSSTTTSTLVKYKTLLYFHFTILYLFFIGSFII